MKISILIPTYNRRPYLLKNIEMLASFLRQGEYSEDIEIIISNNCSSDDTDLAVKKFSGDNNDILIHYYLQERNIGPEQNCLFVLSKASGDYVLFLGDDDFIDFRYLQIVYNQICENGAISTIIPSYLPVDIDGRQVGKGRDVNKRNRLFNAGFRNCLRNAWRGHQLSGLVFKNEGILENYEKYKVSNIYLFIFLVGNACLNGTCFHCTAYPVKVTQPGQANKDWGYKDDGRLNDIFDNYLKLPVNKFQTTLLELNHLNCQPWRLWNYSSMGMRSFFKAMRNIWFCQNSTFGFRLIFPILIIFQSFIRLLKFVKKMLKHI